MTPTAESGLLLQLPSTESSIVNRSRWTFRVFQLLRPLEPGLGFGVQ